MQKKDKRAAKIRALARESVRICQALSLGVSMIGDLGVRATFETDPVRLDNLKEAMTSLAVLLGNGQFNVAFLGAWADVLEADTLKPPPVTPGERKDG